MRDRLLLIGLFFVFISACNSDTANRTAENSTPANEKSSIAAQQTSAKTAQEVKEEEIVMEKNDPLKYLRTSAKYTMDAKSFVADVNVYNSAAYVNYNHIVVKIDFQKADKSVISSVDCSIPVTVMSKTSYTDSYTFPPIPEGTQKIKVKIKQGEVTP